jgi:hypothetical protein
MATNIAIFPLKFRQRRQFNRTNWFNPFFSGLLPRSGGVAKGSYLAGKPLPSTTLSFFCHIRRKRILGFILGSQLTPALEHR